MLSSQCTSPFRSAMCSWRLVIPMASGRISPVAVGIGRMVPDIAGLRSGLAGASCARRKDEDTVAPARTEAPWTRNSLRVGMLARVVVRTQLPGVVTRERCRLGRVTNPPQDIVRSRSFPSYQSLAVHPLTLVRLKQYACQSRRPAGQSNGVVQNVNVLVRYQRFSGGRRTVEYSPQGCTPIGITESSAMRLRALSWIFHLMRFFQIGRS